MNAAIVRLHDPLPCSTWTPTGACGTPAYLAYAWPATEGAEWPVRGLWTLQPVCPRCAQAAAEALQRHVTPREGDA